VCHGFYYDLCERDLRDCTCKGPDGPCGNFFSQGLTVDIITEKARAKGGGRYNDAHTQTKSNLFQALMHS
jgi:hypothetical protein